MFGKGGWDKERLKQLLWTEKRGGEKGPQPAELSPQTLCRGEAAVPGCAMVRHASKKARECFARENEYNMRGLFKVQVVG